jgi:hypothetical protein
MNYRWKVRKGSDCAKINWETKHIVVLFRSSNPWFRTLSLRYPACCDWWYPRRVHFWLTPRQSGHVLLHIDGRYLKKKRRDAHTDKCSFIVSYQHQQQHWRWTQHPIDLLIRQWRSRQHNSTRGQFEPPALGVGTTGGDSDWWQGTNEIIMVSKEGQYGLLTLFSSLQPPTLGSCEWSLLRTLFLLAILEIVSTSYAKPQELIRTVATQKHAGQCWYGTRCPS